MKKTEYLAPRPNIKAWLVVQGGPQDGRSFLLQKRVLTVGKDAQLADIVLTDATVSREHIRLRRDGDHYYLTDLASLNGTLVNNQRVGNCILSDNDVIKLGSATLVYKCVSPEAGK